MIIILFVDGVVLWYSFPAGMCEMEDFEDSCYRVKSTASWGKKSMCEWVETNEEGSYYEEPCTFAELSKSDEFYAELQMCIIALILTLPLIKLVEVLAETYLFAPTKGWGDCPAVCGRREKHQDNDEGRAVAARRLLANLGLPRDLVDFEDGASLREAAAGVALIPTMARVLHRRMELVDALADATEATAPALKQLLACYERTWGCRPEPRWIIASRWRTTFAKTAHVRLVESLRAFEIFSPGLLGNEPRERRTAVYHLSFASTLSPGAERGVFYHTLDLDDDDEAAAVHPASKGALIFAIFLMTAGMWYFLLFVNRMMGGAQMAMWAGAVVKGISGILLVLIPLRVFFLRRCFFPFVVERVA